MAGLGGATVRLEDAVDLAAIMAATGRHVAADRWVDELVAERAEQRLDAAGSC